jgi:hypothetical protein
MGQGQDPTPVSSQRTYAALVALSNMQLFRPVGLEELRLIAERGFRSFPPRLPDQPIFYPVTSLEYARQIAADWNTKTAPFVGFVTAFHIDDAVASQYPIQTAGSHTHQELWVPANELDSFNAAILRPIRVLEAHVGPAFSIQIDPHSNLPAGWNFAIPYEPKSLDEFVNTYSKSDTRRIRFAWNGLHADQFVDTNAQFRNLVLERVADDIELASDELVRDLYLAVTEYSKEAWAIDSRTPLLAQTLLCRSPSGFLLDYVRGASQSFDAGLATAAIDLPPDVLQQCLVALADAVRHAASEQERRRLAFFEERFRGLLEPGGENGKTNDKTGAG